MTDDTRRTAAARLRGEAQCIRQAIAKTLTLNTQEHAAKRLAHADDLEAVADQLATQAAEIARLRQECAELRGAMAADDERLRAAERRVWGDGLTYGCDGPDHLADEIERLRTALEAARAFVARLDECQPHIDNAFLLAHGSRYSGPNYADELKELRAALTSEVR